MIFVTIMSCITEISSVQACVLTYLNIASVKCPDLTDFSIMKTSASLLSPSLSAFSTVASDLYQQLSEDLNLDKHLVESFIDFYYTELRKTMSDLKYPRINVEGLGHFHVKPQIVKKAITSYSRLLESYNSETRYDRDRPNL